MRSGFVLRADVEKSRALEVKERGKYSGGIAAICKEYPLSGIADVTLRGLSVGKDPFDEVIVL